uniref:Putative secreted protein n=1 Tax=Anopheles marajoara TaxID=58244 RepID=A0A2M4C9R4_9DIPT
MQMKHWLTSVRVHYSLALFNRTVLDRRATSALCGCISVALKMDGPVILSFEATRYGPLQGEGLPGTYVQKDDDDDDETRLETDHQNSHLV